MEERITSRRNPLLTHTKKLLTSRSYREKTGEFAADGVKLLAEAARWYPGLTTVIAEDGIELCKLPEQTRVVRVPKDVMQSISLMDAPQGAIFLCRLPEAAPAALTPGTLLLDGIQDPGNLGTILRTADAFECDGVFLVNACADLFNPKTARATMGAIFRREAYSVTPEELFTLLSKSGVPLYGTALREDTVPLSDANLSKAAVAIGSEGRGLSQQMLDECAKTLKIPMSPRCESLNAAIAATVVLWEMYR